MRAYLASPTYGPVSPVCVSSIRVATMAASKHGVDWVGDVSPDKMTYMDARNHCAEALMLDPSKADGIMWVDSDMVPETNSIWQLIATAKDHQLDFVSGVYHSRRGRYQPLFYSYNPASDTFLQNYTYELGKIVPAGGCGFGFVWTSTKLIQAIQELPGFATTRGSWFPDHHWGDVSEDLAFCRLAHKAGFQPWVNTSIQVGHLGENEVITRDHFLRLVAKLTEESKAPTP